MIQSHRSNFAAVGQWDMDQDLPLPAVHGQFPPGPNSPASLTDQHLSSAEEFQDPTVPAAQGMFLSFQ